MTTAAAPLKLFNSPDSIREQGNALGWQMCDQVNWREDDKYTQKVDTDYVFLNDEVGISELAWKRSRHDDPAERAIAAARRDQKINSLRAFRAAYPGKLIAGYASAACIWFWQRNERNQVVPAAKLDDVGLKQMQEWHDEFQQPIADEMDWLAPSTYDTYDNEPDSAGQATDASLSALKIREAKRMAAGKKPVVAFCWMRQRPVQQGVPGRLMSVKDYVETQTGIAIVNGVGCMSWGYWVGPVKVATDPTYSPTHPDHAKQQYYRLIMVTDYYGPLLMPPPLHDGEWMAARQTLHNFYAKRVLEGLKATEAAYQGWSRQLQAARTEQQVKASLQTAS